MSRIWRDTYLQSVHPDVRGSDLIAGLIWIEQEEYEGSPNGRLKLKWSAHYSFDGQPMVIPAVRDYAGDHPRKVITAEDVWIGCSHMLYYYPDTDSWLGFVPGWKGSEEDRWFECGVPIWGY